MAGSLLYGLVFSFSAVYLPASSTQYSIVLTFILLALVLAYFRPRGLAGERGMTPELKTLVERGIAVGALVLAALGPLIFNDYWVNFILTQTFLIGIAAASLIFLSAYGGMISLAQVALYGIAGFALGNMVTQAEAKELNLGWDRGSRSSSRS